MGGGEETGLATRYSRRATTGELVVQYEAYTFFWLMTRESVSFAPSGH